MLPLAKYSDIFETRLQPQIVSGERLSMLQDNGFFSQSAVFPPCQFGYKITRHGVTPVRVECRFTEYFSNE